MRVPGLGVAGTVRELGDGVDGFTIRESVVTLSGTDTEGGYAAISVVDAQRRDRYLALTRVAHLHAGETVLSYHGAQGGWRRPFPASRVASGPRRLSAPRARPVSRPLWLRDCHMTAWSSAINSPMG
jgi:NADPH:quinone reductase